MASGPPPVGSDPPPTIQAVQRAALILRSFTVGRPHLSLPELTARLGASKSTGHRYVTTLRAANLLRYDERSGRYSLGPKVLALAASARAALPILDAAEPCMHQLAEAVGETVVLSVWDGEAPTVVRSAVNASRIIRISVRPGARLGLTTSAQGRVFCTFLPPAEVPGLTRLLHAYPELQDELGHIRASGISVNSPAINGVRAIAAPVLDNGTLVAVMAIVGTHATVPDGVDSPIARRLLEGAQALTHQLGGADAGPVPAASKRSAGRVPGGWA
jgi:DNA-binding IclR family transcriptional regulator